MFRAFRRAAVSFCLALACLSPTVAQENAASADEATGETEAPAFGKLPWDDQQAKAGNLPARRLSSPQEMLDLFNIDASHLSTLADGEPLGEQDEEIIVRILYQMPRFPLPDIHRWAKPVAELSGLSKDPQDRHGDVFKIEGRATSYKRVDLLPEIAERVEFTHFFRVQVELANKLGRAVLCTRVIPAAWRTGTTLDEPVTALAFLLKVTNGEDEPPAFAFTAPRIAWYPSEVNEQRRVEADHLHLATLGMDIGLFDDVRRTNRKPVVHTDRECFYHLLATVGDADADDLRSRSNPAIDLAALLQRSREQHGRLMVVRGTVRRILSVRIDDEDIRERLGIDHYYQMDVFVPLHNQAVRMGKDDASKTFENSYPVTICVRHLPPGLPASPDLTEEVAVPASFFKLWAYRSQFVASIDELQVSPMFIGATPTLIDLNPPSNPYVSFAAATVFLVILGSIWFSLWRSSRSDSKFSRNVLKRQHELKADESLDSAGLAAHDEPDFSNLD